MLPVRTASLLAALTMVAAGPTTEPPGDPAQPVFVDGFDGENRLVTNEYAHDHPCADDALTSPAWDVSSGSLFIRNGAAWTGSLDRESPGPQSAVATGSAAFRAFARVEAPSDMMLTLRLSATSFSDVEPTNPWDGAHILVRADGEIEFYSISVLRRDGKIVVKRKIPGGPPNGDTYVTLAMTDYSRLDAGWHDVRIATADRDGTVVIEVYVDDVHVVTAVDSGQYGPPITEPGAVAIRADNLEFSFDDVAID